MPFIMINTSRKSSEIGIAAEFISIVRRFSLQRYCVTKTEDLQVLCMKTRAINISIFAGDASQAPMMMINIADPLTLPTPFESGAGIMVLAYLFPFAIEAAASGTD